ncbi:hypothetical protein CWE13_10750 [Aliidiomarina shirensis]|uniref:Transmembrane protein n=1 Tax=Aliidiomarina shirensis TaxID=1048642 RepID=A0A432WQD3_9GAMM|nr:hypothetical protein [Aliidiomarina shirensis]RUO36012.1 hypothetical protein CWE13_10750 [Aliidiomarina shirensis]
MSEVNSVTNPARAHQVPAEINGAPSYGSAVSWAAILAGAAGAAALSLILVILGAGFGFTAVSPWSMEGLSVATIGFSAILWISFTQIAASGLGGYLAGRLRTKWASVHTDEVYFRDTAHGFLTWAVATLLTAALLTTTVGAVVSGTASAGGQVVSSVAGTATSMVANNSSSDEGNNTIEYFVDSMFRGGSEQQATEAPETPPGEALRIVMRALRTGTLEQQDTRYIAQLVAQRTDISQQAAEERVNSGFNQLQTALEDAEISAREMADEARAAAAYAALWMFVSLLLGAFAASLAAVYGGRQRDV